jgi:excisionase family DNA binding protein
MSDAVRLYSVAQAAEQLSVSRYYIYDRINEGLLPVVELGTGRAKQRVRADDLQAFIDARTFGSPQSPASPSGHN